MQISQLKNTFCPVSLNPSFKNRYVTSANIASLRPYACQTVIVTEGWTIKQTLESIVQLQQLFLKTDQKAPLKLYESRHKRMSDIDLIITQRK
jgi:hypothetical protein